MSGSWRLAAAAAALAIAVVLLAWVLAGGFGLAYLAIYSAATVPGWPIGFALFGRRHAAGWVTGAVVGYAITACAVWLPIAGGFPSTAAFIASWAAVSAAAWLLMARVRTPLIRLPDWGRRETTALLSVLLLAPALFALPYRNLGALDAQGHRAYRAYFTADFLWHMALTAELAKYDMPPVNPYLGDRPVHYYWTYFLVPAVVSASVRSPAAEVATALKLNALGSGILFLGALFVATWCAVPRAAATAVAVGLTVVAASAEGAYALYDLYSRGRPLAAVADMNIDAITAWQFRGLRIDGIPRSLWYTPQHTMAVALGLAALPVAGAAGAAAPWGATLAAGVALALSTTFNPLLGGIFCLIYAAVVLIDALRKPREGWRVLSHGAAAVPVLFALAWCVSNQMVEGAAGTLHIGYAGFARNAPIATLALSLGPVLLPSIVALWPIRELRMRLWPVLAGLMAGLALFYFVRLTVEGSYIGFRAGQVLQVSLPALVALFFARLVDRGHAIVAAVTAVALFAVGLPTTAIDTYNAQDVGNRRMGPGFRWTVTITPGEQAAFRWIRRATAPTAIVQMEPTVRARETWTLIPSFAERRMAAGMPISLLNVPEYEARSRRVRTIYGTPRAEEAWRAARDLGIDYLYVGRVEREAFGAAIEKFETNPAYFLRVFRNADVRIYAVAR